MNQRQRELHERLRSAKQMAIVNRVLFFFCLAIAAIDHYTGERVGEMRYLWAIAASSIVDGAIAAWARNVIEDIKNLKGDQE